MKTIGILSMVALMSAAAFAQPQGQMNRGHRFNRLHKAMPAGSQWTKRTRSPLRILAVLKARKTELKITDEQIGKIEGLLTAFQKKQIQVRSEADLRKLELGKLLRDKDSRDYAKIKALMAKASALRQDMVIEGMKLRDQVMNILTPAQKEAIKTSLVQRFRMGRMSMRGRRGFSRKGRRGAYGSLGKMPARRQMMKKRVIKK